MSYGERLAGQRPEAQHEPIRQAAYEGCLAGLQRKYATGLCFEPKYLRTAAGKAFGSAVGEPADLMRVVRVTFLPNIRRDIRRAERFEPHGRESQLTNVVAAVEQGIVEVRDDPALLAGRVPGFERARRLTSRYRLAQCPAFFRRR